METTTLDNSMASQSPVEAPTGHVETAQVGHPTTDLLGSPVDAFGQNKQTESSWLDKLPDELRSKSTFSKFKDEASLAQAYDNLQSLMGKRISEVPKEELVKHFSPEQIADFYKSQGAPETPDNYQVEGLPDYLTNRPGVKAALQDAKVMAHKHGISSELFNEFVKMEYNLHQKAVQESQQSNFAELSNTYGQNLSKANDIATQAAYKLGGDEAVQRLASSGLASNPMVFNMLYKAGMMMQQDNIPIQEMRPGESPNSVSAIQTKINEFRSDPAKYTAWKNNDPAAQNELRELYAQLNSASGR